MTENHVLFLQQQFNRGMVDATPAAVALALSLIPERFTNYRAIVSGEASLSSGGRQSYRTIPQTIAALRKKLGPAFEVSDRRGGNGRRVLVLRVRCIIHNGDDGPAECQASKDMAHQCAEYEHDRDRDGWLRAMHEATLARANVALRL